MAETITATGIVATEPKNLTTNSGLELTSFRLASSQRRFNKTSGEWEYTESNWFTVTAFRRLATNIHASIKKGDRVLVTGRMRINNWQTENNSGTSVEITADSIGHDLNAGTARFERVRRTESADSAQGDGDGDQGGSRSESTDAGFVPEGEGGWVDAPAAEAVAG